MNTAIYFYIYSRMNNSTDSSWAQRLVPKSQQHKTAVQAILLLFVGANFIAPAYLLQEHETYFQAHATTQYSVNTYNYGYLLYVMGGLIIAYAGMKLFA